MVSNGKCTLPWCQTNSLILYLKLTSESEHQLCQLVSDKTRGSTQGINLGEVHKCFSHPSVRPLSKHSAWREVIQGSKNKIPGMWQSYRNFHLDSSSGQIFWSPANLENVTYWKIVVIYVFFTKQETLSTNKFAEYFMHLFIESGTEFC